MINDYNINLNIYCLSFPPGTYTDTEGLPVCIPCAPGEYASAQGSTSCTDCPVGTVAPWGNFSYQLWPEAMLAAFTTSVGHTKESFTINTHLIYNLFPYAELHVLPAGIQATHPRPGYLRRLWGRLLFTCWWVYSIFIEKLFIFVDAKIKPYCRFSNLFLSRLTLQVCLTTAPAMQIFSTCTAGSPTCTQCPVGTTSTPAGILCNDCVPGYYSDQQVGIGIEVTNKQGLYSCLVTGCQNRERNEFSSYV